MMSHLDKSCVNTFTRTENCAGSLAVGRWCAWHNTSCLPTQLMTSEQECLIPTPAPFHLSLVTHKFNYACILYLHRLPTPYRHRKRYPTKTVNIHPRTIYFILLHWLTCIFITALLFMMNQYMHYSYTGYFIYCLSMNWLLP